MPRRSIRLLMITVSSPEIRRVRRSRVLNFQQITMPYLAAFVPAHWTVRHVDEAVQPVDPGAAADLVQVRYHRDRLGRVRRKQDRLRARRLCRTIRIHANPAARFVLPPPARGQFFPPRLRQRDHIARRHTGQVARGHEMRQLLP